ncbi:phosphotransferase family protein [Nocardia pseudovaccinii]|uniref:phosphotransferase family protein n=1 Tax=Nocardia pseudovaccinii TaxID=189540 RepID=UPI0007C74875|nr:phosphotransferase family protein [Nocardia pseudovaccinii]
MTIDAVRAGDELDWEATQRYLRSVLDLPQGPFSVRQFTAGHANLTYLLHFGDAPIVLRRPPRGTLALGSHDMHREFRVLSRLNNSYPRAPRALHFCPDETIVGSPFIVVEYRTGETVYDAVPASMAGLPDVAHRLNMAVIDAAADLHAVDVDAVGLSDLGKPSGFGERQVANWSERWRRVAPPDGSSLMFDVSARLAQTVPAPRKIALVHNDLKLDNCQFASGEPDTVTAVFDWDMATIGDPLFDIGALLDATTWNPLWVLSTEEALRRYSSRSGADTSIVAWYLAFAHWRTAVVIQQFSHRHAAGDSADDRLANIGQGVLERAEWARELLDA